MAFRGRAWVVVAALLIIIQGASGCGGNSTSAVPSCPVGHERCPCYGNATCDPGLVCRSDRCVRDPGSGGVSGGGTGGTGGAGTGGSTGGTSTGGSAGGASGTGGSMTGGRGGGIAGGAGGTSGGGRGGGGAGGTSGGGRGGGGAGGTSAGGRGGGTGGTSTAGRGGGSGGAAGTGGNTGRGGVGGHAFMFGPAVTSAGLQSIDVFAVSAEGKVWWKQYAAGWSSWQLLPGNESITSDVDATEVALSSYDVYGLGASGKVVHQHYVSGNWLPAWEDFSAGEPNVISARYGTAATLTGSTQSAYVIAWLFATGMNGALWSRNANIASVWGGWSTLQGSLSSAPDAVSRVAATWVVARGASPTEIMINKNGTNLDGFGQWSGFTKLPALAGGAAFSYGPCVTAWSDTRVDVVAPGGGATSLWHNTSTDGGASWTLSNWEDWGGGPTIAASPDCVSWGNGRIDIVVVGADGHVWRRGYEGSLVAWEDLGVY